MAPVEAVLLGAGQRGFEAIGSYARHWPEQLKFVAVAEPNEGRRLRFAKEYGVPQENCFASWEELLSRPQLAPICFNTTMDRVHFDSAMAALRAGYHLFLEKPMGATPGECLRIAREANSLGRMVQVCHPLRYTTFYTKVKELLDSGVIGRVLSLSMVENIANWHFAHSYVRGNWRRRDESGPTILTKCCHDMDIAAWLAGSRPAQLTSFAERHLFTESNAPQDAPARCTDGCPIEETCPYYAPAFYLGVGKEWPASVISTDSSIAARRRALETEQYGRCVYKCDNDVMENQTVNARFENGVLLNFTLHAQTVECFRTIRVIGEQGELNGRMDKREILVTRFGQGYTDKATHQLHKTADGPGGHGGGDVGAIRHFLGRFNDNDHDAMKSSLQIAVDGHLMAFAADIAATLCTLIDMNDYRSKLT